MNQQEQQHGLGLATIERRGELATTAAAARAKAEVEARFVIALNRPRKLMEARAAILDACKRPAFAAGALYKKPVGGKTIDGLSIRFAETAIQALRNVSVTTATVYEDDDVRSVHIAVTDLETNLSYGKDVTVAKTVERRKLRDGQTPISKRVNSTGETVFLVAATEDEIATKLAAAESKVIRNSGLRLVPQDILEEAEAAIRKTLDAGGSDPAREAKRIADAFLELRVRPSQLEGYLGHGLETVSPKELTDLRAIYSTIKDGEASWSDYEKPIDVPTASDQTASGVSTENPGAPATGVSATPQPPASGAGAPGTSPQSKLADAITSAGYSFDDYLLAVRASKLLPVDVEFDGFEQVPTETAKRHLRIVANIINTIKGGAL